MFRKMRRFKQQLSEEECREVLREAPRGVLSVLGDDGYPYGMPINQWWDDETGHLFFHGARSGHKIDAIRACDKVSFCTHDEGFRKPGEWSLNIRSVIVFGRIRFVDDQAVAERALRGLCSKFTDEPGYADAELAKAFKAVQCLELVPEHITGKLVNES